MLWLVVKSWYYSSRGPGRKQQLKCEVETYLMSKLCNSTKCAYLFAFPTLSPFSFDYSKGVGGTTVASSAPVAKIDGNQMWVLPFSGPKTVQINKINLLFSLLNASATSLNYSKVMRGRKTASSALMAANEVSPRLKYLAIAAAVNIYHAFPNRSRFWWSPRVGWCAGSLAMGWRRKGGITLANGEDMAAAVKARIHMI